MKNISEKIRKKQPLEYSEIESDDKSGDIPCPMKAPFGKKAHTENEGPFGDDTIVESWEDTYSPCTPPGGNGPTKDENYGAIRPRTLKRQAEDFAYYNREFSTGAGDGDWTSAKWHPNV